MGFQSVEEAAAWAETNGGETGLRDALAAGRFGNDARTQRCANLWLEQRAAERAAKDQTDEHGLRVREVKAQEDAANAADRSARWALWAFVAAAVSAVAALFAYFRPPL